MQLGTSRVGPGQWDPSHGLRCLSEPPPKSCLPLHHVCLSRRAELPFEVLGQIDFETGDVISRGGGTYFGEATSSSDLPIYARRTRAGESWVQLGHGRICKKGSPEPAVGRRSSPGGRV